ncbi:MAG: glycosyltransferase family 4 protein [Acidobacteria bacterium]|nr:glycosyltransferase family 4 protein [Acidobacteriota bacterium]
MTPPELHFVVPGPIDQRTGGYLYDARIVSGLRELGWPVAVHSLDGVFPDPDAVASASLASTLAAIPTGRRVVIDGLAMGALPKPVNAEAARLSVLSLVHHPLADETGLDARTRDRFRASEREALAACAGVVVTSTFTARRLAHYGVEADRVRAVYPGTDRCRPAVGPAHDHPPALLCVGSVTPRKGHDVLVRALARLRHLSWTCVCAGSLTSAPYFAEVVDRLIRDARLEGRVQLIGECDSERLDALYHHASLFVLPSYYEGYGMALSEALARGLGVVSTTGGAIPHTVPNEAGVLVEPGDDVALTAALRGLLAEPGGRAQCGALAAAASRYAETLPGWDEAAERFAAAVQDLAPDGNV